jgi:DNA-binding NarL/FixJ family response regulator
MARPIRVLIVDDHAIVREGLRLLLHEEADLTVVGEAGDGAEALALAAAICPDVVLLDLAMPGLDGLATIPRLRQRCPTSQVLVLTSFGDERRVRAALQAGAIGYLLKDVRQAALTQAIRAAADGQPALHPRVQQQLLDQVIRPTAPPPAEALTQRERDVLRAITQGASNKEIAARLHLTEGTVKGYVGAILGKLGVADRTQAAVYAVRHGLAEAEAGESEPAT